MASITMTAPFVGGAVSTGSRMPTNRRLAVVARATGIEGAEQVEVNKDQVKNSRRDMMFAAAAAAVCSAAAACGAAMADEPKRGTPEAKKKYAPICVTMPTASICHK